MDKTWEIALIALFLVIALPILFRLPLSVKPDKPPRQEEKRPRHGRF